MMQGGGGYAWWMLAGIGLTALLWIRIARRDGQLPWIYLFGLVAALIGAKLAYLFVEGWADWRQPDTLRRWATGKSILGGLLFGYLGVEGAKWFLGYSRITGDRFALLVPIGITFGRIGCLTHGCCQGRACSPAWYTVRDAAGVHRWPAVPSEIAFNLSFLAVALLCRWRRWLPGQLFHLYLMAYGAFRFLHEFVRDTPRGWGPWSGYQVFALAVFALGAVRFRQRQGVASR